MPLVNKKIFYYLPFFFYKNYLPFLKGYKSIKKIYYLLFLKGYKCISTYFSSSFLFKPNKGKIICSKKKKKCPFVPSIYSFEAQNRIHNLHLYHFCKNSIYSFQIRFMFFFLIFFILIKRFFLREKLEVGQCCTKVISSKQNAKF